MEDTTEEKSIIPKTTEGRVKLVAGLLVGKSVSTVFKTVLRQNFVPKNNMQRAELLIASYALGGAIAKGADKYTDEKIDFVFSVLRQVKGKMNDAEKPVTTEAPAE